MIASMSETGLMQGVVLRWGELFLKGMNRGIFTTILAERVRAVLRGLDPAPSVTPAHGRIYVDGRADREVLDRLGRVFGISSLSPVFYVAPDPDRIVRAVTDLVSRVRRADVRTFRISTNRPDKRFPFTSVQLNALLGEAVRKESGLAVDLGNPDLDVGVEIAKERSFIFLERIPGPGGLPVGTSGRGMLLLSGGIDSPVAGFLAQKRGLRLSAVHFHSHPYTSEASQKKAVDLSRILAIQQEHLTLSIVPFSRIQEQLRQKAHANLLVVLFRRSMVRISERIARNQGVSCLVTGESLGQVASQTLENLSCIEKAASLSILRPLITYDKQETIRLARMIGTYATSIRPHDDCCSVFLPQHPVIRADVSDVEQSENIADISGLEEEALSGIAKMDIEADFSDLATA